MRTNFEMVMELDANFTPKQKHVVSMEEIYKIDEALCLGEMDELGLRNLRDFVVMFYDIKMGDKFDAEMHDKMSAITAVIDNRLMRF